MLLYFHEEESYLAVAHLGVEQTVGVKHVEQRFPAQRLAAFPARVLAGGPS